MALTTVDYSEWFKKALAEADMERKPWDSKYADYEIPKDMDGNPMPAAPVRTWEQANRQLALLQVGMISVKTARRELGVDFSAPGGVVTLGPGEDCEIIPPQAPPAVRWQGNCEHCGHRYMDTDRCCPFCGGQLLAPPPPEPSIMGHPVVVEIPREYEPCLSPPRESDHHLDAMAYLTKGLLDWRI